MTSITRIGIRPPSERRDLRTTKPRLGKVGNPYSDSHRLLSQIAHSAPDAGTDSTPSLVLTECVVLFLSACAVPLLQKSGISSTEAYHWPQRARDVHTGI
jgi:hypothetical protein